MKSMPFEQNKLQYAFKLAETIHLIAKKDTITAVN
jgi:hypothetical protein